jgi:hypothetical protein
MQFTPRPLSHNHPGLIGPRDALGSAVRIDNLGDPPGDVEAKLDGLFVMGSHVSPGVWAQDAVKQLIRRALIGLASDFGLMAREVKR